MFKSKRSTILFLVVCFILLGIGTVYNSTPTPVQPTATEVSQEYAVAQAQSRQATLAVEWACNIEHRGQTFIAPYTDINLPEYENRPIITEFDYAWKGLQWKLGVTCLRVSGETASVSPTYSRIVYDRAQPPDSPRDGYLCGDTSVVVSGREIVSKSCLDNTVTMDDLRIHLYYSASDTANDTHGYPLQLNYEFHSDTETLTCRWQGDDGNDTYSHRSLEGKEKGYFLYPSKNPVGVTCAGTGYTVELYTH